MKDGEQAELTTDCPADDALLEVIVDTSDNASSKTIEHHLEQCQRCQRRLEELSGSSDVSRDLLKSTVAMNSREYDQFIDRIQAGDGLSLEGALPEPAAISATQEDDYSDILDPPSRPDLIGLLGDYEIEEKVASGGMGIVFKANDPALNRTVAIKVLRLGQTGMNDARERFVREAQAAAGIDHENILPIYHVNHEAKSPYLVMPFILGKTLDEVIQQRGEPMAADEIIKVTRQIASGLAAAHDRGLIHRDIKPANLLVEDESERIWIADFGLARAIWDPSLTVSGSLTGTPLFMSPEQASEAPVDARSDLFSLGSVLYYLATAKLPFTGTRSLSILRKVCEDDPPAISELNPAIPLWLTSLISRLMQKDPADRLQSAEEIIAMLDHPDLAENFSPSGSSSRKEKAQKRRATPYTLWIAAGGAFAGAAAIGIALYSSGFFQPPDSPETQTASPAKIASALEVSIVRKNGNSETVATLSDAVMTVRAGDVIELAQASDSVFTATPLRLDRPITIRAKMGQKPTIECPGMLFETAWPLKLEGLVLRCTSPDTAVIDTSGRELQLTNCQIENTNKPTGTQRRGRQLTNPVLATPMIQCAAVPSIIIRNCQLASETTLLRLQPSSRSEPSKTTISIGNSVMQSSAGITLELARDVRLDIRRCLIRTDRSLLTLHRNPRSRQNGKCALHLSLNSIISTGPFISFGSEEIAANTSASFATNAWNDPTFWSAGIFPGRRANNTISDSKIITRNHKAFLQLFDTRESDPIVIQNNQLTKDNLRTVAKKFPIKRRPDMRMLGPGTAYDTFRESSFYERTGKRFPEP
ncbi:MAG: serine/threonine protein kinase [Verrucomicrobiales bacterium]|jgi:serine/threonine protein kinase